MKPRKILISGEFVERQRVFDVNNPQNGKLIANVSFAGNDDIDEVLDSASQAGRRLRKLSIRELADGLLRISGLINEKRDLFAKTIAAEAGKPIRYSLGEVDRAVETFRLASEEADRLKAEPVVTDLTAAGLNTKGYARWEPRGIVVGITPFNFPLNLVAHKVAPALAARNPIIIKPSERTPLSALLLGEVFLESGLPSGSLQVVPMTIETLEMLNERAAVKTISFTGSDEIGWSLREKYPRKKVLLELGGNAPVIVDEGLMDSQIAKRVVAGAYAYSGQVCISVQRAIIVGEGFEYYLNEFVSEAESLKYGSVFDPDTEISEMISIEAARKTVELVEEAKSLGARVVIGGKAKGAYLPPTIITETRSDMRIVSEEIFAPVLVVERAQDFAEAVSKANDSKFGLQAGVFTSSARNARIAEYELEYGGVIINDTPTFRVDNMPYGGIKDSGNCREGVHYAMRDMSELKMIVHRES